MCNVISLLNELSEHDFAVCINSMNLSASSFADDISLPLVYDVSGTCHVCGS